MRTLNNIQVSKDFKLYEFECPCCGLVKLESVLLDAVQALRSYLNNPLSFDSAFRCQKHNKAVKGSPTSQHLFGTAVDIPDWRLPITTNPQFLKKLGFTTVLYYPGKHFWHLDVRVREFYANLLYVPTTKA